MAIEKRISEIPISDLDESTTLLAEQDGAWKRVQLDLSNLPSFDDLGDINVQADWNESSSNSDAYIKNKPAIKAGAGQNSLVISDGNAQGKNSVAGGSNDSNEINKVKNMAQLAGYNVDTDNPTAYGDGSLALGVGAKAYSMGSMAIGISNSAGVKGFYWHSINWGSNGSITIQLTTEQKRYYKYKNILNQDKVANQNPTWDNAATGCADLLANWQVGDAITIVNDKKYGEAAIITAIESSTGIITVNSLPFTSSDVKVSYSYTESLTLEAKLALYTFDDLSIYNTSRPKAGVIELAYGALSLGLMTNAAGSFSSATGYDSKVTTDFGHAEGIKTVAGYAAHAEGQESKATGIVSHVEGYCNEANGFASHAEGAGNKANASESHVEGGNNTVDGYCSHAEGLNNYVTSAQAHAEGANNRVTGDNAHAEGAGNESNGNSSHVEGGANIAPGNYSHVEGYGNKPTVKVTAQHIQGKYSDLDGLDLSKYAHIVGWGAENEFNDDGSIKVKNRKNIHTLDTTGTAWFAGDVKAGNVSLASVNSVSQTALENSQTALSKTNNIDQISHNASEANAMASDALYQLSELEADVGEINHYINEELYPLADTAYKTANQALEKANNIQGGDGVGKVGAGANSVIFNDMIDNEANGDYSFAEGKNNKTSGKYSHVEGIDNKIESTANYSHVEGGSNTAVGNYSHIEGYGNKPEVALSCQHLQGKYIDNTNIADKAHVVGWGSGEDVFNEDGSIKTKNRKNIHTLDIYGNAWFASSVNAANANFNGNVKASSIEASSLNIPDLCIKEAPWIDYVQNPDQGIFYRLPLYYLIIDGKFYDYAAVRVINESSINHSPYGDPVKTDFTNSIGRIVDWYNIIYNHADNNYWVNYGSNFVDSNWYTLNDPFILENVFSNRTFIGTYNRIDNIPEDVRQNSIAILKTFDLYTYVNGKMTKIITNKSSGYFAESFNSIDSKATGNFSHAEGVRTWADGYAAHAEGDACQALGAESHAEGAATIAHQYASHAEGCYTEAHGWYQHVQGKYNDYLALDEQGRHFAHMVGNGEDEEHRSNCHTLDWNGNAWYSGSVECTNIILRSPNGTRFKLSVSDDGTLNTEII